jgi:hypothetical protein
VELTRWSTLDVFQCLINIKAQKSSDCRERDAGPYATEKVLFYTLIFKSCLSESRRRELGRLNHQRKLLVARKGKREELQNDSKCICDVNMPSIIESQFHSLPKSDRSSPFVWSANTQIAPAERKIISCSSK